MCRRRSLPPLSKHLQQPELGQAKSTSVGLSLALLRGWKWLKHLDHMCCIPQCTLAGNWIQKQNEDSNPDPLALQRNASSKNKQYFFSLISAHFNTKRIFGHLLCARQFLDTAMNKILSTLVELKCKWEESENGKIHLGLRKRIRQMYKRSLN